MGYAIRMPQMGMTMQEGAVVEWGVEVGDELAEGDVVCVVESEKTTNEVYAREDGVLRERFVELEEVVEPGAPIAFVGGPEEAVPAAIEDEVAADSASAESEAPESPAPEPASPATSGSDREVTEVKISPRARRYADANDIADAQLAAIEGTGPEGAVVEQDVITAHETGDLAPTAGVSGRGIFEEKDGSRLRQTIADRMTTSVREAPQVTLQRRVDIENTLDVRERLAMDREREVSLTDFLIAAVCEALDEYPAFNAIYEDDVHKLAANQNIGIAVDIEDGLVSPVLKGAGELDLDEIGRERQRLVELAQSREYTTSDLADGTFTITNLGMFEVEFFDPILDPPQVAILGVGARQGGMLPLSLTFDHRAVDGADAARFLGAIADALAHPLRLVERGTDEDDSGTVREREAAATDARVATARSTRGMQATVRSRQFEWPVDEPTDRGGDDTGPTPVESFLGSLASCLALSVRTVADRRDIVLHDIDVTADGEPDEGRIERILLSIAIDSPSDRESLEQLVETAERVCFVNNLVDEDIEREIDLEVTG